ncbi:hypothetical protein GCM10023222_51370 [Saccharopolyspora cebuensis]
MNRRRRAAAAGLLSLACSLSPQVAHATGEPRAEVHLCRSGPHELVGSRSTTDSDGRPQPPSGSGGDQKGHPSPRAAAHRMIPAGPPCGDITVLPPGPATLVLQQPVEEPVTTHGLPPAPRTSEIRALLTGLWSLFE